MRAVQAGQLVMAVVVSLLLNAPSLLASSGPSRIAVVLLVGAALSVLLTRGLQRPRSRSARGTRHVVGVSGVVTVTPGSAPVDPARFRRRLRWMHVFPLLWLPMVVVGTIAGSVVGAALLGWWGQLLLGALGFAVVDAAFRSWAFGAFRRLAGHQPPGPT